MLLSFLSSCINASLSSCACRNINERSPSSVFCVRAKHDHRNTEEHTKFTLEKYKGSESCYKYILSDIFQMTFFLCHQTLHKAHSVLDLVSLSEANFLISASHANVHFHVPCHQPHFLMPDLSSFKGLLFSIQGPAIHLLCWPGVQQFDFCIEEEQKH